MNEVQLVGRLARDPEVRYSQGANPTAVGRYTLAVKRNFKNKDGDYDADFIPCVVFGVSAEFAQKYFRKGMLVGITGRIQTGSYEKDGRKVYTTEVIIRDQEFCESKKNDSANSAPPRPLPTDDAGFMKIPEGEEEELPFA